MVRWHGLRRLLVSRPHPGFDRRSRQLRVAGDQAADRIDETKTTVHGRNRTTSEGIDRMDREPRSEHIVPGHVRSRVPRGLNQDAFEDVNHG